MKGSSSSFMLLAAGATASLIEAPFPGPTNAQEIFANAIQAMAPMPTKAPLMRWMRRQDASTAETSADSEVSAAESSASALEASISSSVDSELSSASSEVGTVISATGSSENGTSSDTPTGVSSGSQIGWLGPDNTCGYIGGSLGAALTCSTSQYCAAALISGIGTLACCNLAATACTFFETCIDYSAYVSSSACNHVCMQDVDTAKCTNSAFPYCYPYTVPGVGALYYSCDATTTDTPQPFLTTFIGETDGRTWTPVYDTEASTGSASVLTKTGSITSASGQTGAGLGSASQAGASSGTSASSQSSSPTSSPQSKSSTPVGAIVGGVVGGLAVIGAVVAAIVYFCLRSRKQNRPVAPLTEQGTAPQSYAAQGQYEQKQAVQMSTAAQGTGSPTSPQGAGQQYSPAELSGDYHQPVMNPQGQPAHELPPGHQPLH